MKKNKEVIPIYLGNFVYFFKPITSSSHLYCIMILWFILWTIKLTQVLTPNIKPYYDDQHYH